MIKKVKNYILEFVLKNNFIISTIITICIILSFYNELIICFSDSKKDILNMLISTSGTLFGFILTFLSILIIFRTDDKYIKKEDNKSKPLIMLVNNNSFNDVYELFISSSYSLVVLLIISIIYYFTTYGLNCIVNSIFIFLIIELITVCMVRLFISVYAFNTLIKIIIKNK